MSILKIGVEIVVCYRDWSKVDTVPVAGPERAETGPKRQFAPITGPEKAENRPEMIEAIFAEYKNKCLFCFV